MVSLVIVSHSHDIAQGVMALARQMAGDEVRIVATGGLQEEGEWFLGTDPMRILQAIEAVWSEEGVLVLLDLGSAVLSTELACEMLSPEQQPHVHISNAPLVEGAVVAALEASLGHSLAHVNHAAEESAQMVKVTS